MIIFLLTLILLALIIIILLVVDQTNKIDINTKATQEATLQLKHYIEKMFKA